MKLLGLAARAFSSRFRSRHWPWVQSGFLTLHTLVMMMKMHSYMNINGYLQHVSQQTKQLMSQLRKATEAVGGYEQAMAVAKARRRELDQTTSNGDVTDGASTPVSEASSTTTPPRDATLRRRMNATTPELANGGDGMHTNGIVTTGNRILQPEEVVKPGPHPLTDYPDEDISNLAREFSDLSSELVSNGPEYVHWPNNVTYRNFLDYLLIPTLVYELEYPRTDKYVLPNSKLAHH